MKIAIVHDHLNFMGGGERTVMMLAVELKADFITAYASPETFPELQKQLGKNLIILSKNKIKTRVVRFFWLRSVFWRNKKIFKNYDLIIASAPAATEAVAKYAKPRTVKITYTHTTPRRIFDQYEISKKFYPIFLQPFYAVFARFWKWLYLSTIKKYDINIANSENTRQRIIDHTGGDANAVVWPPIMTEKFKWLGQEDYFLSYGRLDEAKRIEVIIKAFQKMPNKKLVVASGGPRLEIVKKLASGYDNIKILGWVSDEKLFNLVGKCRAIVYIPIDEDAGMTHLEANAAGKPVLGVAEGGLKESIIEKKTGILIKSNPNEDDIIKAAEIMTSDWCRGKKEICEEHAKKYDQKIFFEKMKKIIENNNPAVPVLGIDALWLENTNFPEIKKAEMETALKNIIENIIPVALNKGFRVRVYTSAIIKEIPMAIQKIIPVKKLGARKALTNELKYSPVDYFYTFSNYIPKNAPKKFDLK
jgi:glycosyltransferase involved in cell wall biosynthesis